VDELWHRTGPNIVGDPAAKHQATGRNRVFERDTLAVVGLESQNASSSSSFRAEILPQDSQIFCPHRGLGRECRHHGRTGVRRVELRWG
jgi:hypothetical protein